jgi:hypothetical protein
VTPVASSGSPAAPSSPTLLPSLKQESLFARLLNSFFNSIDHFRTSTQLAQQTCCGLEAPHQNASLLIGRWCPKVEK